MSEKRSKASSSFADSYKIKSGGIDRRSVRAHRRSQEWKSFRDEEVNKRRNISTDLSPLKEEPVRPKGKANNKESVQARKDKLAKWRMERDLKKKIEKENKAKKPTFKMAHVKEAVKPVFEFSKLPKVKGVVPTAAPVVNSTRVTRSRSSHIPPTATTSRKPAQKMVKEPQKSTVNITVNRPSSRLSGRTAGAKAPAAPASKSGTRTTTRGLPSSTSTSTAAKSAAKTTKSGPTIKKAPEAKKRTTRGSVASVASSQSEEESIDIRHVTKRGELQESFAPKDFMFTAPENVPSFTFKPLSPSSASQFLFPGLSSLPSPDTRRCSTPKVSGLTKAKVVHSPGASMIVEGKESSASDGNSDAETGPKPAQTSTEMDKGMSAGTPRRRSAAPSKPASSSDSDSDMEPKRTRRRESRVLQELPVESLEKSAGAARPARKSRVQQLAAEESESSSVTGNSSDEQSTPTQHRPAGSSCGRTPIRSSRRSVAPTSDSSDADVFTDEAPVEEKMDQADKEEHQDSDKENVEPEESLAPAAEAKKPCEEVEASEAEVCDPSKSAAAASSTAQEKLATPSNIDHKKTGGSLSADRAQASKPVPSFDVAQPEFRTPQPAALTGRRRMRSEIPTNLTPAGTSPWRRHDFRNSFILKGLSPEECVEVLKSSPMVEMSRRTPKVRSAPAPTLDFEEVEEIMNQSINSAEGASMEEIVAEVEKMETSVVEDTTEPASDSPTAVAETAGNVAEPETAPHPETAAAQEPMAGIHEAPVSMDTTAPAPVTVEESTTSQAQEGENEGEHDVPYFRRLLVTETDRLNVLSDKWNEINDSTPDITEEVRGQIRTTVGQAQLLIAQRFKQFRGLVDDCEFKRGEKETTCTDLQGFWDMIYFQVEDVDAKFEKLDKLREANWKVEAPQKKKIIKKKPAGSKTAKAGGKPAARSKFAEFRARMAQQKKEASGGAAEAPLLVLPTGPEEPVKTFEAGFFSVSSPVREVKPHCQAGSPARLSVSSRPTTPAGSPIVKAVLERNARRSVGRMSLGYLLAPSNDSPLNGSARLSGEEPVPSPLLKDSTPSHLPPGGSLFTPDTSSKGTPKSVRRSARRSVRLNLDLSTADETNTENIPVLTDEKNTEQDSESMDCKIGTGTPEDIHMAPTMRMSLQNKFRHASSPAAHSRTPKATVRRSLSSSDRRRSRVNSRRSVHFALNTSAVLHSTQAPGTPYNRDSLVPRRRRSSARSSCSESTEHKENLLLTPSTDSPAVSSVTPATQLAKLTMDSNTPVMRKSKRISGLGFTPPTGLDINPMATVTEDDFSNLMVFSPISSNSPSTRGHQRRSVRNSTSLL